MYHFYLSPSGTNGLGYMLTDFRRLRVEKSQVLLCRLHDKECMLVNRNAIYSQNLYIPLAPSPPTKKQNPLPLQVIQPVKLPVPGLILLCSFYLGFLGTQLSCFKKVYIIYWRKRTCRKALGQEDNNLLCREAGCIEQN